MTVVGLERFQTLAIYIAGAVILSRFLSWRQRTKKLPPGPPKLPFIDNLHNMPVGMDWIRFTELGIEHNSDVIHFSALGSSIVVLNSYEAARELLDKRSGIYSGRFESTLLNDLGGLNVYLAVIPTGDHWRACRRLLTKHIGPSNKHIFTSRERHYVNRFLHQLMKSPENFRDHIRHLVGASSLSMTYGLRPTAHGDPNVQLAEDFVGLFSEVTAGGAFLVDLFPSLAYLPTWFPGASFHRVASRIAEYSERSRKMLLEQALQAMKAPNYEPSFVSECLEEIESDTQLSEEERKAALLRMEVTAVQIYAAAADSSVSAITSFFLAMICYPDVQRKLQQELDGALHGRMPTREDIANLPYLTAVTMEVLRWRPVSPIGVPHQAALDDIYKGYHLPKDSIVIGNQWQAAAFSIICSTDLELLDRAMLHDPDVYPDPQAFRPERFLKDGKIDESVRSPVEIAFGFGRRICPGRHIALSLLMLTFASVVSNFNLTKERDEKGEVIEPTQEIHPGIVMHAKDFPCSIQPRSSQVHEMIEAWALQEEST